MPTLLLDHGVKPGTTGLLGETLREYGHRMRVVRVAAGESLPGDLDDVDAIVLGDGQQTLLANAPAWAEQAMSLVRQAHTQQLPMCGLGFGARLLAKALGGELAATADLGWRDIKLNFPGREDPIYKGVPWSYAQIVAQSETISKLPEGATPFGQAVRPTGGSSTVAFAAGVFAYGFEHQWWLTNELAAQMASRGGEGIASGWREHGQNSIRHGRRIAESIALYLMPVDRVNAGRVKDLHY